MINIGRLEKIHLPDLELFELDAKIDTGAYTSSLHCHDICEDEVRGMLQFKLLDPSHPNYCQRNIVFNTFTKARVKASTGITEIRYKIKTLFVVGKIKINTEFTLTDRSQMKYPVLIGRKVLYKRFLVDVSQKYILSK